MKEFTKEEFKELYAKYHTRELAKMCDCSVPTLYKRLNEFDIKLKGRGKGTRRRKKLIITE